MLVTYACVGVDTTTCITLVTYMCEYAHINRHRLIYTTHACMYIYEIVKEHESIDFATCIAPVIYVHAYVYTYRHTYLYMYVYDSKIYA